MRKEMTVIPYGRMCFLVTSETRGDSVVHLVDIEPIDDDGSRRPMLLRCGCEDHTFRQTRCKHILCVLSAIASSMQIFGPPKSTRPEGQKPKKRTYILKR